MRSFFCLTRSCFSSSSRFISVTNARSRAASCSTAACSQRTSHRSFVSRSICGILLSSKEKHPGTKSGMYSPAMERAISRPSVFAFNSLQLGAVGEQTTGGYQVHCRANLPAFGYRTRIHQVLAIRMVSRA